MARAEASYFELIETLDKELSEEKKGFFGAKVDTENCARIVKELKKSYPEVVKEAKYIVSNKEQIIDNANRTAAKILKDAAYRAEREIEAGAVILTRITADLEGCLTAMLQTVKRMREKENVYQSQSYKYTGNSKR